MTDIQKLKVLLNNKSAMKYLGAAHKILGMKIHRDRKQWKHFLSLKSYIQMERFTMPCAKPVSAPLATHFCLLVDLAF